MDWWNVGVMIVTLVATGGAGLVVLRRLIRREYGALREESREAHEKIGGQISDLRNGLRGDIADLRKELGDGIAELREGLADLREGQAGLREGIAGLQGEMKGMRDALLALRKDFRAHVLAKR